MSKRFMKLVAVYLVGWMAVIPTGFVLASSNGLSLRDTDALSEKKYSRLLEAKSLGAGEQGVAMQELSLDSILFASNLNYQKQLTPKKDKGFDLGGALLWGGGGFFAGSFLGGMIAFSLGNMEAAIYGAVIVGTVAGLALGWMSSK
jgi:hypothetical protein